MNEGRQIECFATMKLHPKIITPRLAPEMTTRRVLTMTFVEGVHLDQFLKRNPSQELRNYFGQIFWEFFNRQIISHSYTLYADIHPGNFLFRDDGLLGVLDFGCVKTFPASFLEKCLLMFDAQLSDDTEELLRLYYDTEILKESQRGTEKEAYLFDFFRGMGGLILHPFHQDSFDFGDPEYKMALNTYFKEASQLYEARGSRHYIFLSKVLIGLYSLLMKLKAQVKTETSKNVLKQAVREIKSKNE